METERRQKFNSQAFTHRVRRTTENECNHIPGEERLLLLVFYNDSLT
jgi:hypothetical protein